MRQTISSSTRPEYSFESLNIVVGRPNFSMVRTQKRSLLIDEIASNIFDPDQTPLFQPHPDQGGERIKRGSSPGRG